jgi:MoaA/NifB/PqqE/SkfB family radical SAM enzyme
MSLVATTARAGAHLIERAPPRIRGSYRVRRLGRRLLHDVHPLEVPERPIGAKLELTYHCNLRCGFCYTDSPRRTLARTAELSDEQWRGIVGQVIELGLVEAVITGGEPLLRRELTLETVERLTTAGVMVTLNTNGWFLDAETADRLARTGARVHVSLDGASAELHDASRGVPGSWRRAVEAIDLLLTRGGRVQVVHVVTPRNEATFAEFLEQMRLLAPTSVRVVPVGLIGAAAREGKWAVDFERVHAAVDRFGHPARPRILMGSEMPASLVVLDSAPRAFLVRPNGAFLADSQHPFSFGDAGRQDLDECWRGLRAAWRDRRVSDWRAGARNGEQAAARDLVPYRDDEQAVSGLAPAARRHGKGGPELDRAMEVLQSKMPDFPADGRGDIRLATARIRELALARRHRLGEVRWGGSSGGERLVRVVASGHVKRLNRTAGTVMDALDGGTAAVAIDDLRARNPRVAGERIERDALDAVSGLIEAGIAVPALADRDGLAGAADEGSLSGLPD